MGEDDRKVNLIRRLMVATVVDTGFLQGLRPIWREDLVGPGWRWLSEKCFTYLDKHGEAPGRNIQLIWEAEDFLDPEVRSSLETILSGLSEEWESSGEPLASQLLLEMAQNHFAKELYLNKSLELEEAAEAGNLSRCKEIVEGELKPPSILSTTILDPSDHSDLWKQAFEEESRSLVKLGGAFQELVGSQITRDSFTAFLGKEKVGKTWLLQSIAFAGVKAGSRVLFCQCGDLSLQQQLRRIGIQLTGRNNRSRYNSNLLSPVLDCYRAQDGSCQRKERVGSGSIIRNKDQKPYPELEKFEDVNGYEPCSLRCSSFMGSSWWKMVPPETDLVWEDAYHAFLRWNRATGGKLRLDRFPNRTATIEQVDRNVRQLWETKGWRPEIIILDYLDIFAPEPNSPKEFRHQENARWTAARRLSQDWECAVVTATQAPKDTYRRRLISEGDSSEDKRKAAHVTAYFGLNRDHHDKRRHWLRINPLFIREDDFDVFDQVTVLQLIERGQPNLNSFWYRKEGKE